MFCSKKRKNTIKAPPSRKHLCNIRQFNWTPASSRDQHNWDSILLLSLGCNISQYRNNQTNKLLLISCFSSMSLKISLSLSLNEHEFTVTKFDCKQFTSVLKSLMFNLVRSLTEKRIKFKFNFTVETTEINRSILSSNLLLCQVIEEWEDAQVLSPYT